MIYQQEIDTMNDKSAKLSTTIVKAGINIRRVSVIGSIAHIDSFQKYHDAILHLMTAAGFKVLRISNGAHMDGTSGYRASFIAA